MLSNPYGLILPSPALFQLSYCEMLPDQESCVLLSLLLQQLTALHSLPWFMFSLTYGC